MWRDFLYRDIAWADISRLEAEAVARVSKGADPELLIFEPQPTFTSGFSAQREDLLWSTSELQARNIATHTASRGGKWTYHGPGQIVIFPIVRLEQIGFRPREVRAYVDAVRAALVAGLSALGVASQNREEPYGVYVNNAKIASFGFGVRRGVSQHGVALYYSAQQDPFSGINPCGQRSAPTTSLQELGLRLTYGDAARHLSQHLKSAFPNRPRVG